MPNPATATADNLDTRALAADLMVAGLPEAAAAAVVNQINGAFKLSLADTAKKSDLAALQKNMDDRFSQQLTELRVLDSNRRLWTLATMAGLGGLGVAVAKLVFRL